MMQVKLQDGFLFVKTPYNDKDFVKTVLNGVWSKKEAMNRFPANYQAMLELLRVYPDLQMNPAFMEHGRRLKTARDRLLAIKARGDGPGDRRLRPYQRVDVEYLSGIPSAGIFNEPRTGKTPTSILLIKKLGTVDNLIVSPASLIWNWTKEFEIWAPDVAVYTVTGTPTKRQATYTAYRDHGGPKVLIFSKDTWKLDQCFWDHYEFATCFVDEAHYLRNYKTAQSKSVFTVKAQRRYALTGTPTVKHALDIWGILHFLYPKKFPSYWQFAERYFVAPTNLFTGNPDWKKAIPKPEREKELQEIVGFASVQRKRSEVMAWLPAKTPIPFYVKMEGKQAKLYKSMAEDFSATDEEADVFIDTANVLAQLTRMRQLCLDPRLLGFTAPSAKTEALLEWLDDNREPVVIMSMFTSYLKMIVPDIEKLGRKVGMIHGEMSNVEKEAAKVAFQAGETDVILCNIISAGVGHTLDRAETIVFTDKAWNPSDNEQAEDRITPVTEERNHRHTILTFQCQDSYDEAINRILDMKRSITDVVNHGGRAAIQALLKGAIT